MKNKSLLTICSLILLLVSCEHANDAEDSVLLRTGNGHEYRFSDFELYDSSTHIFYFKTDHPEFNNGNTSTFYLLANGEEVYMGDFHPGYSSTMPQGPFIWSDFSSFQNYSFKVEYASINAQSADPRNDPRLISALEDHNLLHSGLSGQVKDVIVSGTNLTFTFIVTNFDNSDLLILDPEKTGPRLFHYFTNAPVLYNFTQNKVFSFKTDFEQPDPWNKWDINWLSYLKPGDSRQFTFTYTINSPPTPGIYRVLYSFPGFSYQIPLDQLYQGSARIWLGDIYLAKYFEIQ